MRRWIYIYIYRIAVYIPLVSSYTTNKSIEQYVINIDPSYYRKKHMSNGER